MHNPLTPVVPSSKAALPLVLRTLPLLSKLYVPPVSTALPLVLRTLPLLPELYVPPVSTALPLVLRTLPLLPSQVKSWAVLHLSALITALALYPDA